jgi:RNA polymerase sigma factor (sigma-70 family)
MLELEEHQQNQMNHRLISESDSLRRYVSRNAADAQDAADIYQESILRVMEQARASVIHNPIAYAMRIARNLILNKPKQPVYENDILDEIVCSAPSPEESLNQTQKITALKEFLASMPPLRREVFLRRRMRGESRAQIANTLQLSEDSVKKHITRALSDLQKFLDEHNNE